MTSANHTTRQSGFTPSPEVLASLFCFMIHDPQVCITVFSPRNLPKELPSGPLPCTPLGRSHPPSAVGRLVGHPSQCMRSLDDFSGLVVHPVANQQLKVAEPGANSIFPYRNYLLLPCCFNIFQHVTFHMTFWSHPLCFTLANVTHSAIVHTSLRPSRRIFSGKVTTHGLPQGMHP